MPTRPSALSAVVNGAGNQLTITYSAPVIVGTPFDYAIVPGYALSAPASPASVIVFSLNNPMVGPIYPILNYDGARHTTADASDPTNYLNSIVAMPITGPVSPPPTQIVVAGVPTVLTLYRIYYVAASYAPYARFNVRGATQQLYEGVCGFPTTSPFNQGFYLDEHPKVNPLAASYDLTFIAPLVTPNEFMQVSMKTAAFSPSNQAYYIANILVTNGTPPDPPDPPTGTGACEGAKVTLFIAPYAGALTFDIYRDGVLLVNDTPTLFYVDNTAVIGVTYSYTVTVTTAGGTSAQSAAFVVTPCAIGDTWVFNPEPAIPAPPAGPLPPEASPWTENCSGDLPAWERTCSGEIPAWARVQVEY